MSDTDDTDAGVTTVEHRRVAEAVVGEVATAVGRWDTVGPPPSPVETGVEIVVAGHLGGVVERRERRASEPATVIVPRRERFADGLGLCHRRQTPQRGVVAPADEEAPRGAFPAPADQPRDTLRVVVDPFEVVETVQTQGHGRDEAGDRRETTATVT
ncbi:MAG: hypothetical protein J07HB67_01852 [halophilic archaeon J07HB67]|nr:MAG: hypothetical protein J07HB67_01852 [halophilic archaeon J07HB67]